MMTAQKLYESGHITYMRTDSPNMASVALGQIKGVVTNKFGVELHQFRNYKPNLKMLGGPLKPSAPLILIKKMLGLPKTKKDCTNLFGKEQSLVK